jgi:hypothetical protein
MTRRRSTVPAGSLIGCGAQGPAAGVVIFRGAEGSSDVPRCARESQEEGLASYARLQHDGRRQRAVREGIVAGLTSRN